MAPPSLLAHLDASRDSTALSLAYASIGDEGCNAVARFMRENVMLKQLDLRGNNIRADGLVVLAHALRNNSNLGSLCMKWNHVGSHQRGIQALCDVLKENKGITHVDFRNNKIGAECGPLIAGLLTQNNTITHLDLSWNDLGAEGGKALLEGIQNNHSVIDCQLSGNRIAEDTLHAIAYVLRRNRTSAPLSAVAYKENAQPTSGYTAPATSTSRDLDLTGAGMDLTGGGGAPAPAAATSTGGNNEGIQLKLLQKERDYANADDARFFGEVAEYIDLLQLDVARNKKYRMDAEERERVVTKGFMEREMRYAQEMRELENLLAKAKADKAKVEASADLAHTIDDLLKLGEYNAALHQDCDFLLKNYEVRQSSRAEEIESLKNALAIFSGANFGFFSPEVIDDFSS